MLKTNKKRSPTSGGLRIFKASESSDEGDSGWSSSSSFTTNSSNSEISEDLVIASSTGAGVSAGNNLTSVAISKGSPPSSVSLVSLYPQQSILTDTTNKPVITISTSAEDRCSTDSSKRSNSLASKLGPERVDADQIEDDPVGEVSSIVSDITNPSTTGGVKKEKHDNTIRKVPRQDQIKNQKNRIERKKQRLRVSFVQGNKQKTKKKKSPTKKKKKKVKMSRGYGDEEEILDQESDYEAETTEDSSSSSENGDNVHAGRHGTNVVVKGGGSSSGNAAGRGARTATGNTNHNNAGSRDSILSQPASSTLNGASNHSTKSSASQRVRRRSSLASASTGLSWKSDPKNSFMDWTVHIVQEDTGHVDVYPVHRNMVGFGLRKSLLLLDHFQEQIRLRQDQLERHQRQLPMDYSDNERWIMNSTSRLSVPSIKHAKAFPMVLDYLYHTRESKASLSAELACCVYVLAQTLKVDGLSKAITDFYAKNLSLKNMGVFLNCAAQLIPLDSDGSERCSTTKGASLLAVSKNKIGTLLAEKPELAGLVPPHFLTEILDISRQFMEEKHKSDPQAFTSSWLKQSYQHWNKAVVTCCVHHEQTLTVDMFDRLTSEKVLPTIDTSMAINLLQLHKKFHGGPRGSADAASTTLEGRCIDCITDNWSIFQGGYDNSDAVSNALKDLPNDILAQILVRTMNSGNKQTSSATSSRQGGGDGGARSGRRRSDTNEVSENASTTSTEVTSQDGDFE